MQLQKLQSLVNSEELSQAEANLILDIIKDKENLAILVELRNKKRLVLEEQRWALKYTKEAVSLAKNQLEEAQKRKGKFISLDQAKAVLTHSKTHSELIEKLALLEAQHQLVLRELEDVEGNIGQIENNIKKLKGNKTQQIQQLEESLERISKKMRLDIPADVLEKLAKCLKIKGDDDNLLKVEIEKRCELDWEIKRLQEQQKQLLFEHGNLEQQHTNIATQLKEWNCLTSVNSEGEITLEFFTSAETMKRIQQIAKNDVELFMERLRKMAQSTATFADQMRQMAMSSISSFSIKPREPAHSIEEDFVKRIDTDVSWND
jgi:DNA repair exonuclease SbcCD ATPase subunit